MLILCYQKKKKEVATEAVEAAIEKEGEKVVEKWWVLKPKDIDRI